MIKKIKLIYLRLGKASFHVSKKYACLFAMIKIKHAFDICVDLKFKNNEQKQSKNSPLQYV